MRRVWLARGSALLLGCALATGLAEVSVRVLEPNEALSPITTGLFQNDPETDYLFKANLDVRVRHANRMLHVTTNADGLSERAISTRNGEPEVRIAALGDSYTWGGYAGALSLAIPRRLEALLSKGPEGAPPVRVYNLGVPGFGTRQARLLYERLAARIAADVVVLFFFVGNDYLDNESGRVHRVVQNQLVNVADPPLGLTLRVWLYRHSHLYRTLEFWNPVKTRWSPYHQAMGWTFFPTGGDRFRNALERTRSELRALRDAAAGHGARFLLVAIPAKLQIEPDRTLAWGRRLDLPLETADVDRPSGALAQIAREEGIDFLDLLPTFRAAYADAPSAEAFRGWLYLPDGHTNDRGNDLIARSVVATLRPLHPR